MSSDHDKFCNSTENETKKKVIPSYMIDDNSSKNMDEFPNVKYHPMRYHQNSMKPQGYYGRLPNGGYDGREMMNHRTSPPGMVWNGSTEDSDLADAMVFLNKIKEEYHDALPVYDSFLETMRDFKFGKIDAEEVCKAVRTLFKDKAYLIRRFEEYLPQYLRYNDNGRGGGNVHNPYDRSNYGKFHGMGMPGNVQGGPGQMGRMMGPGRSVQGPPYPMYMNTRVRTTPPGMQMSGGYKSESDIVDSSKHKIANEFIQLVKTKYAAKPYIYKQFIEILQNSKNGFDKIFNQVSALLHDSPELIERFEMNFRPNLGSDNFSGGEGELLKSIKSSLAKKGLLEEFLKIINFYNQNYITADNLVSLLEPIIDDKENMDAFKAFIKYEDYLNGDETEKEDKLEKIGSYRLYPEGLAVPNRAPVRNGVLNNICYSVSTLTSEDDTYIFREKNSSEELLSRISDDRAEADLKLGRIRYFMARLEEIHAAVGEEDPIDLEDIEMAAPIIKEILRDIYDKKGNDILETILSSPAKTIPIVINRLLKVYRNALASNRTCRKYWRELVGEHYYRAFDTKGVMYKSDERSLLSLKHLFSASEEVVTFKIDDNDVIELIKSLFSLFAKNNNRIGYKKYDADVQIAFMNDLISKILSGDQQFVGGFDMYALLFYFFILYSRFKTVKDLNLKPITVNPIAVKIGLAKDYTVSDRYQAVVDASKDVVLKIIDADVFEEKIRQLTDSLGYQLINLKKILSRLEKQVIYVLDIKKNGVDASFPGKFTFSFKDNLFILAKGDNDDFQDLIDICG